MNMKTTTDPNSRRTTLPIRAQGSGFVAEGPGFYIWDEDINEVLRVARELERGNLRVRPSNRLLVIPPQETAA
jgi:hypothetical protein